MLPLQLVQEVEILKNEGRAVEIIDADGVANVVFHNYQLPTGYSKSTTALLLKMPLSYPNGRPDMFWTDENLILKSGTIPKGTECIEEALGRKWRRFSWHPSTWNPATCNLLTYLEFVNNRLAKFV